MDKLMPADRRASSRGLARILRNLTNVLNSKRSYSSALLPDFGIRTLTEYGSREAVCAAVIDDVRQCITRYEPRLRLDDIVLDEGRSPLHLAFTLRCTVLTDPHELQISFDTVFNRFEINRR